MTYHSYGQYILYPWGYDKEKNAPNWRKMHAMAELAGRAMQGQSGHKYTVGAAAKVLYPAAGESRGEFECTMQGNYKLNCVV